MPGDSSLLDPASGLIQVEIDGRQLTLPADNTLLRILQHLGVDLDPCRLCWNGDCNNCVFAWIDPSGGEERETRGCETRLVDGMRVTRLPGGAVWPS